MPGQGIYNVDIVMCIDGTASMRPIIEEVKRNALELYPKFEDAMALNGKDVGSMRIKFIVFRDYGCDAEPMAQSRFFVLPEEAEAVRDYVMGIEAKGGGDIPENALEAIATALKSDWVTEGSKKRHVIVVFSDAPALPLGARAESANYPSDMPKDLRELSALWEGTVQTESSYVSSAGRLIAFVPNDESWTQFEAWNRFTPAYTAGRGCNEVDMQTVLDTIVGSFEK